MASYQQQAELSVGTTRAPTLTGSKRGVDHDDDDNDDDDDDDDEDDEDGDDDDDNIDYDNTDYDNGYVVDDGDGDGDDTISPPTRTTKKKLKKEKTQLGYKWNALVWVTFLAAMGTAMFFTLVYSLSFDLFACFQVPEPGVLVLLDDGPRRFLRRLPLHVPEVLRQVGALRCATLRCAALRACWVLALRATATLKGLEQRVGTTRLLGAY